jgi:cytidylate kinase
MDPKQFVILGFSCLVFATKLGAMEETPSKSMIVFLEGPVSTGKSSLCRELIKHEDTWRMVSDDAIYFEQIAADLKEEFPEEFGLIADAIEAPNLIHAITQNQILFRTEVSDDRRTKAKEAILALKQKLSNSPREVAHLRRERRNVRIGEQIIQTIINTARTNNVIVDAWFLDSERINQLSTSFTVTHLVAYSSFLEVIRRTMKRNCDALMQGKDISNVRFLRQAVISFGCNYEFTHEAENTIDCADKNMVTHALDLIGFGLQDTPAYGEFSRKELDEYRQDLMAKFAADKVYVAPKYKRDAVIRTDLASAYENAQVVLKLALKKKALIK